MTNEIPNFIGRKIINFWPVAASCNVPLYPINWALNHSDDFHYSDWEKISFGLLSGILKYAENNTNFYAEKFNNSGFAAKNFKNLSDFERIPVTTRGEFKKVAPEKIISKSVQPNRYLQNSTSGSTGEPLSFFQDKSELGVRSAAFLEELRYHGADMKRSILIIGLPTHKYLDSLGKRFPRNYIQEAGKRKLIYDWIRKNDSPILITAPSILDILASKSAEDKMEISFSHILYRGESLEAKYIEAYSKFFNTKVFSSYGTRECSMIAMQCEYRNSHLIPWLNYVEITDESGKPVSEGNEGRILVTYFFNKVMPFIRYDIGDRGFFNSGKCRCGRQTKLITYTGRNLGNILLPSGKKIPALALTTAIAKNFSREIFKFKLEQPSMQVLKIYFRPADAFNNETGEKIKNICNSLLGNEVNVILSDSFPINNEEKMSLFIPLERIP